MTDIAELATAAETLRNLAQAATPGPWRQHDTHLGQYGHTATVLSGEGNSTELRAWLPTMSQESWDEARNVWADASYIAVVHPAVGLALAEWLGCLAMLDPSERGSDQCGWCGDNHALTVARAITQPSA